MQDMPHHYRVAAAGKTAGNVTLTSSGVDDLVSAPPAEFGGPGDQWSPESLLVAAVADCFILSFRAVARASRVEWTALHCEVDGTLDRVDREIQFTDFAVTATLDIPATTDESRAMRALQRAEKACLITNSLKAGTHLEASIRVDGG